MIDPTALSLAKSIMAYAAPFLLAGLAGLGTLYKLERDKRLQVELKLNENKAKIYAHFVEDYSALFYKPGGNDHTHDD